MSTAQDIRGELIKVRMAANQARLFISKARMISTAIEAASQGPIGILKAAQLLAGSNNVLNSNTQIVNMLAAMESKENLQEAFNNALVTEGLAGEAIARKFIIQKLGTQLDAIHDAMSTYVQLRDTCRDGYKEITELLKLVNLL